MLERQMIENCAPTLCNHALESKGLHAKILKISESRALLYVYRISRLQNDLKIRLQEYDCFPHEIGIFLDYPLSDVIGFIKHGGKNYE